MWVARWFARGGLSQRGCAAQKPFVEIKAGMVNKSEREGGAKLFLSADKRRGLLQLIRDAEGMMHLQWKDRRTNAVGFDLTVFPDEWDYALVKQCDGPRIIRMRFKQGVVSKDHFFWIQVSLPTSASVCLPCRPPHHFTPPRLTAVSAHCRRSRTTKMTRSARS